MPMDEIVNLLLLTIIFVFDPLAISLVIAANYAFDQLGEKKKPINVKIPSIPSEYEMERSSKIYQKAMDEEKPTLEEADLPTFDEGEEKKLKKGSIKGIRGSYHSKRNIKIPDEKNISKEEFDEIAKRNNYGDSKDK